jgi:hypothetical protein
VRTPILRGVDDVDGVGGAGCAAGVAAGAEGGVDFVLFVGSHGNGVYGTALRTAGAADATVVDGVVDQGLAAFGGAAPLKVCGIFLAEMFECGENRIGCGFAKSAETATLDLVGEMLK